MTVLWTCMIHDGDFNLLKTYIESINSLVDKPTAVRFFCSGPATKCAELIKDYEPFFSLEERRLNDGFNRSFNIAVHYAIRNNFDWMISMTIRCNPQPDWLQQLDLSSQSESVGMITTLILNQENDNLTFNLGHNISPSGGCYDFGSNLMPEKVIEKISNNEFAPIGPCSGAGVYRTNALINRDIFIDSDDIVNPALFKSYNCDAISYFVLANGFKNIVIPKAVSFKSGLKDSSSNNPNSLAINMNMEISRLTNILTYFEDWGTALKQYEEDRLSKKFTIDNSEFRFRKSDLLMIRLFAQQMSRIFSKSKLDAKLTEHIGDFASFKDWYTKAKNEGINSHRAPIPPDYDGSN